MGNLCLNISIRVRLLWSTCGSGFQYYANFWRYIRTILSFTTEETEFRKSAAICPGTLYPNFWRYIRSKLRFKNVHSIVKIWKERKVYSIGIITLKTKTKYMKWNDRNQSGQEKSLSMSIRFTPLPHTRLLHILKYCTQFHWQLSQKDSMAYMQFQLVGGPFIWYKTV